MIIPFLRGLLPFHMAPMTWTLVYLNVFLFCFGYIGQVRTEKKLEDMWFNDSFVETTGRVFANYVRDNPNKVKPLHRRIVEGISGEDDGSYRLLAGLAFKDEIFLTSAESLQIAGDPVAMASWKTEFVEFRNTQFDHPSYIWGLSAKQGGPLQYISYQFSHGGLLHLFGNMFFLLIFGSFIEAGFGSLTFLGGYLVSGVVAALAFALWSGFGYSPLIGASGAVSGLMAFVGTRYFRRNVTCGYFVLPFEGYFGLIYLPGWTIFLLWLVTDIAGVAGNLSEFGGVAHSAHIGGAIFGILWARWHIAMERRGGISRTPSGIFS